MFIGLTGGIGSGKSAVSDRFKKFGIQIVDADEVAREVVVVGSPALETIESHFGQQILNSDKSLNRRELRNIIFATPNEKYWLENLLHPIIRQRIIELLNNTKSLYAILSSPLLLETDQYQLVDRILVVDADESLQISRASSRDSSNSDQIKKIMLTQLSRKDRCAKAQDIIHNNGDLTDLDRQVAELHSQYLDFEK